MLKGANQMGRNVCSFDAFAAVLPRPLSASEEQKAIEEYIQDRTNYEKRNYIIEHNLRLVAYIARKFDNTRISFEDRFSVGSIGLIKAVKTFNPDKGTKLATYAARCIENEILMLLRRSAKDESNISFDDTLYVDWDGNTLTLRDILSDLSVETEEAIVNKNALIQAISKLQAKEISIIFMYFVEGKKQHEISDILNISQSYISRVIKGIIRKLRSVMIRY
jgi:RNA polymerase sporulation-specific sigma factor